VPDCEAAAKRQGTVIRGATSFCCAPGACNIGPDGSKGLATAQAFTVETANWLTKQNIVTVGADNEAVEVTPSGNRGNWLPGIATSHRAGVPQIECLNLEELSHDKRYEFAFIGAPFGCAITGSPIRPMAFPLKS